MALKKKAANTEAEATPTADVPATKTEAKAPAVSTGNTVFVNSQDLIEACDDAEFGTFLNVSASNGTHMAGDVDLGKEIEFQVILQKDVWKMSANDNSEEAREYFATSYEGEADLEDAKQEAIDAGYAKAGIKKYLELYAMIVDCEDAEMVGEVVVLNLAPSSVREWKPLSGKLKVRAAMGKLQTTEVVPGAPAVVFKSVATPTSWKGNNYSVFKYSIV
jgi:hypothetical protein